jgi:hypothetical protein
MVDEHIVAILPHSESIIDAMLTCVGESVAVVHLILISWAFFDSREQADQRARARDAECATVRRTRAHQGTTACVQLAESTLH